MINIPNIYTKFFTNVSKEVSVSKEIAGAVSDLQEMPMGTVSALDFFVISSMRGLAYIEGFFRLAAFIKPRDNEYTGSDPHFDKDERMSIAKTPIFWSFGIVHNRFETKYKYNILLRNLSLLKNDGILRKLMLAISITTFIAKFTLPYIIETQDYYLIGPIGLQALYFTTSILEIAISTAFVSYEQK